MQITLINNENNRNLVTFISNLLSHTVYQPCFDIGFVCFCSLSVPQGFRLTNSASFSVNFPHINFGLTTSFPYQNSGLLSLPFTELKVVGNLVSGYKSFHRAVCKIFVSPQAFYLISLLLMFFHYHIHCGLVDRHPLNDFKFRGKFIRRRDTPVFPSISCISDHCRHAINGCARDASMIVYGQT